MGKAHGVLRRGACSARCGARAVVQFDRCTVIARPRAGPVGAGCLTAEGALLLALARHVVVGVVVVVVVPSAATAIELPPATNSCCQPTPLATQEDAPYIAEGAGRFGAPDGARFYSIARGSAMECKAIVDAVAVLQLAEEYTRRQAMELLTRIVEMLTRMCRRADPPARECP
ncbi:MAG: four helix bundle protein [Myxococcales bacterium]|nr:four helix bundle protein [Myxococcales bacterium]